MKKSGKQAGQVGILVGGGPAPGINGVIGAATIGALDQGLGVVGIYDGFKWLMRGDLSHARPLTVADVERARFRGGSILHTSRENPTTDDGLVDQVVRSLKRLGIRYLVTIGGDDTAFSAYKTCERANGEIKVAHVPKTIDNDLPLPLNMPTFGFRTAWCVGEGLIRNLVEDARTTQRWYLVVAMGRSAGHLALGMGTTGGADLALIPEEFRERGDVSLDLICDTIEGAVFKGKAQGRDYGVAVIAEGLGQLVEKELARKFRRNPLVKIEYDSHGHLRLGEIPQALNYRRMLEARANERGEKQALVNITIGYELRCARPIPFDAEYVQQLGWGAIYYLLNIGEEGWEKSGAMMSVQADKFVPIPFSKIMDVKTGECTIRFVDMYSDLYRSARAYMTRLEREDLMDEKRLKKLAATANLTPSQFREKYGRVVPLRK